MICDRCRHMLYVRGHPYGEDTQICILSGDLQIPLELKEGSMRKCVTFLPKVEE